MSNKLVNLFGKAVSSKLEDTNGGTSIMRSNEQVSYTYGSVNPSSGYVQPDMKLFPRPANFDEGPKFDEDAFDRKSFVPEDHEPLFSTEALQRIEREQYADVDEESAELSYYNTPSQVLDFTCQDHFGNCLKGVDVVVIPEGVSRKPDMEFDEAIRTFLQGFQLPSEAQKTDCIMEKFIDYLVEWDPGIHVALVPTFASITLPEEAFRERLVIGFPKILSVLHNVGEILFHPIQTLVLKFVCNYISKCLGLVAISQVEEIVLDLTELLIRHIAGEMGMLTETFTLSCSRFVEILKSPSATGKPKVAALVKKASRNMVSTSLFVLEHTPNLLMLYSLYLLKEAHIYSFQVNSNTNPGNVELEKNIIETCEVYMLPWLESAIEEGEEEGVILDELKNFHLILLRGSEVQMKKFAEALVSSFWFSLSFGCVCLFPCDQLKLKVYLMLSSIFDKALDLDCGQPIRDAYMHLLSDHLRLLYFMGQQSSCDPENAPFLESIMKSNCPKELEPAIRRSMVHVNFVKKQEGYPETQRSRMAFQGVGRILGCGSSSDSQNPVLGTNVATAPPSASTSTGSVDRSLPLTLIQLRLADGTRRVARFNHQHTVGDTQVFIGSSRPEVARTYQLQIVDFPPKPCILNVMLHSETAILCNLLQGFQGSLLEKLVITIWDPGIKLFFIDLGTWSI